MQRGPGGIFWGSASLAAKRYWRPLCVHLEIVAWTRTMKQEMENGAEARAEMSSLERAKRKMKQNTYATRH